MSAQTAYDHRFVGDGAGRGNRIIGSFLRCERDALGLAAPALEQSASHQVHTLIQTVQATPLDTADATAAMERLNTVTDVFTEPQRRAVLAAKSHAGRGSRKSASTPHQQHLCVYEYAPDKLWTVLMDNDLPWDVKRYELIAFVLRIGLVDP